MRGYVFLLLVAVASAVRYDGWQTLRITPENEEELKLLKAYEDAAPEGLDFWRSARKVGLSMDVMVPPRLRNEVKRFLDRANLKYRVGMQDIQAVIDEQMDRMKAKQSIQAAFDFSVFHTYEEIAQWVMDFSAAHSIVQHIVVGQSTEGRNIYGMKISSGNSDGTKAVYYQGGIHAREWLSPATLIWIVNQMVTDYESNVPEIVQLLDRFDYYVVPQFNADGYSWTWSNDRMWRKNRNQYPSTSGCVGVDLNRNYAVGWGGAGTTNIHCGGTFRGPYAHSEVEIQITTNYLMNLKNQGVNFYHFVDFHTYSQLLLGPWSYSATAPDPPEVEEQTEVASRAAAALEVMYGTSYTIGPSAKTLYEAAGASNDWGYQELGAKYSYVIELRDTGDYGFVVPESYIIPSGIETYEAVKVFGAQILSEFGN